MGLLDFAEEEARRNGLDPALVLRLMQAESGGRVSAVSPKGARGPMQLMPGTARDLGVNIDDPLDNIRGGVRYLAQQMKDFGSPDLALAAYNAGPGNVRKYGGVPPFAETQAYVGKITGGKSSNPGDWSDIFESPKSASTTVKIAAPVTDSWSDIFESPKAGAPVVRQGLSNQQPLKIGREGFADALASVVSEQNPITAGIASAGNTAMQYVRGVRQMMGMDDTKEGKNQDVLRGELQKQFPVSNAVGDIGAQIGMTYLGAKALPTSLLTKAPALANPYVANTLTGGLLGGMKYGSLDDRVGDAALGAAGGGIGTFIGRSIPAAYQGLKGIVEPFTQKGQQSIVGRTLREFSVDPSKIDQAARYASRVPGVNPTLAEAALDPGISNLQRQYAVGIANQQLGNNAARVAALRSAGGSESDIARAVAARSAAADPLYALADDAVVTSDDALRGVLDRLPQGAMEKATNIARMEGKPIGIGRDAQYTGRVLDLIKKGIDDALDGGASSSVGKHEKRAAQAVKEDLLNWVDSHIEPYGAARKAFADLSKPINSMQVGNEILRKASSAAEDAMGNPTLRNEALSRVLRDGDALAQNVTGFSRATLRDTMDPTAMQTLADVRKDLARAAAADNLGKAKGSPTAQNLAASNLIRQIAGPLGAPAGFAEANIWPTLLRPVNFALKAQEPKIEEVLIRALRDPKFAAELAARKQAQSITGGLLGPFENYAIPGIAGGLLDARQ